MELPGPARADLIQRNAESACWIKLASEGWRSAMRRTTAMQQCIGIATDRLAGLAVTTGRYLTAAAKAFWQRKASVDEIDRLGPQETGCLARDLGVSPDEIRLLAAKDCNAADLLYRRMKTIGLDRAHVDPAVMRDLQRGCSKCLDKGLCVHELEDRPREPTWPRYCPNEQTLAALAQEQASSDTPCCEPPTTAAVRRLSG
jgi:hypothetical protein